MPDAEKSLLLSNLSDIYVGKKTPVFQRPHALGRLSHTITVTC
jgi:hypothetical protein